VSYKVGSTVIHPQHGPAKVVAKTKREFGGKNVSCLELEITSSEPRFNPGMRISVVESRTDEIGIREAASVEDADEVLAILSRVRDIREPTNWSRRFKNHTGMLASGDIFQVAAVVRNLFVRSETARVSAGERTMQMKAEHLLAAELAVTWDTTTEEAVERMRSTMRSALAETVS